MGTVEYVKTIDYVERQRLSAAGNPRFRVFFTDGTSAFTKPDSMVNYIIENREHRNVPLIVTAEAGLITKVRPVKDTNVS